jgi:hypothetical protein
VELQVEILKGINQGNSLFSFINIVLLRKADEVDPEDSNGWTRYRNRMENFCALNILVGEV